MLFEQLIMARAHFVTIDSRMLGHAVCWRRCCFGMLCGVLFEVLRMVRSHVCKIDGRVLWECYVGVLFGVMVLAHFCD